MVARTTKTLGHLTYACDCYGDALLHLVVNLDIQFLF